MPQRKIEIRVGDATWLFQENVLKFLNKRPEKKIKIHRDEIHSVAQIAAYPKWAVDPVSRASGFCRFYKREPDVAAAILNFLRGEWKKLENSNYGCLRRFLASAYLMQNSAGEMTVQQLLTDGEIATAYTKWMRDEYNLRATVKLGLVIAARKEVVKKFQTGEELAKKKFDRDGFFIFT